MRITDVQKRIIVILLLLIGGVLSNGNGKVVVPVVTLPGTIFLDGAP